MHPTAKRTQPYALSQGEGQVVNQGIDFILKASEAAQGSGNAFVEYVTRQGEEPPPHTHATEDEMFYVLEGAVSFHCGGQDFEVSRGGYTIRSEGAVRLIVVTSPVREGMDGGWGGFVSEMENSQ